MSFAAPDAGSSAPATPKVSAAGWGLGALAVIVVYFQFPKSRGFVNGFFALVMLGLILGHYDAIKTDFSKIVKG